MTNDHPPGHLVFNLAIGLSQGFQVMSSLFLLLYLLSALLQVSHVTVSLYLYSLYLTLSVSNSLHLYLYFSLSLSLRWLSSCTWPQCW